MLKHTLNGALTHSTTGNSCVDLFFKTTRDLDFPTFHLLLEASRRESLLDTVRLLFHLRDCRGGKGEKRLGIAGLLTLAGSGKEGEQMVCRNLKHLPSFGSYKDLLRFLGTPLEKDALKILVKQLRKDRALLKEHQQPPGLHQAISLAAKWAPSEGGAEDRQHQAAHKVARLLGCSLEQYRKEYLVPLRKHIKIVETLIVEGRFDEIDFSTIPSIAMDRYKKLFKKRCPERFADYINRVASKETKINVGQLEPHQITKQYLESSYRECLPDVEVQWEHFVEKTRQSSHINNALAIVDVSNSMSGRPLEVATALGLLLATITKGPFHKRWITFSTRPVLETLRGETLREQLRGMTWAHWEMSTDLIKVFQLILHHALQCNTKPEEMPTTLFIFSDMQFDEACHCQTNFEEIEQLYQAAGYQRPKIIFWNLAATNIDFPVTSEIKDTALVSGFNPSLFQLFVDGAESINPTMIMRMAIDAPRYQCIV